LDAHNLDAHNRDAHKLNAATPLTPGPTTMRKVVFIQFISLDGVPEEPSDWFIEDGPELFENIAEVIGTQDDVLLGRRTYDYWVGHWPGSDFKPFAPFINATRKHVATSTDLSEPWENSVRMTSPVAGYVRDL